MYSRLLRIAIGVAVLAVLAVLPLYLQDFWLQLGLLVMATCIGAIGLNLLTGSAGQLSLAHAFFLAIGAYGYSYLAGSKESVSGVDLSGLHLPTVVAAVLAVALAGLAGLLFSPISGRLKGIYLGLASLALVTIGQYLLTNLSSVTGGYNGRSVPKPSMFGFSFGDSQPDLSVLGVPYGHLEKLWYLYLAAVIAAYLFARNLLASRAGRAIRSLRRSETAAAVLGVNTGRYRAVVFVVSSIYAGAAGVLLAITLQNVVPEYFGFLLSIDYLAMIVIGGLGSVRGAVVGAVFVTALPQLLDHYSANLGVLGHIGNLQPAYTARYIYGAAIIAVVLLEPRGLARLSSRLFGRIRTVVRTRKPLRSTTDEAPAPIVPTKGSIP